MIANLQLLRGLAALMIVVIHSEKILEFAGLPRGALQPLYAGIDVFFVISGFIMVHVTSLRRKGALNFARDRAIRIVPVYWLMTLMFFVIAVSIPALGSNQTEAGDLLRSLFFIPYGTAEPNFAPILYVGWTLNMEMYFYLLFAVSLALSKTQRGQMLWLAGLISIPVTIAVFINTDSLPLAFYGRPIALEFLAGALLAYFKPQWVRIPRAVAAVLIAASLVWIASDSIGSMLGPLDARFAIAAILLVGGAVALEHHGIRCDKPWAMALGAASYVLYLSHPLVMSAFNNLQRRIEVLQSPVSAILLAIAAMISALITAWLIHRYFELVVTRKLKAYFQ